MLTVRQITDGVNAALVRLYPDRTVYVEALPEKFARPSFFIRPEGRTITTLNRDNVQVQQMVTVQCIDTVDDHYAASTDRLYEVADRLTAALLQRGAIVCGGRKLTAERVDVSRALDVADVTISMLYEDARPADPETLPLIESVQTTTKPKEG
ncbi:hypothetical protein RWV98_05825 [Agathobaculum sp. NTUH-O15-33]|uniref:phage tail terminator family protein n=1 Tax=Agathobaculum sp. NTUH-O15-33 TaxID=3079302 RepID=UPI002958AF8E|nr:hypothetical protein [Agathobaculum sp. NTUH-O15-33]WNX85786.1 hypothetical protein RWV98_05825 [Agathobaculum sp. NTUH-O15-33]